jgi:hypothetical protein
MNADDLLAGLGYRRQAGWRLSPADELALGTELPSNVVGVYLMCTKRQLIYAGRSDACLRTRLVYHEHLRHAGVVLWRVCPTIQVAYQVETWWYERLHGRPGVLNRIQPAKPKSSRSYS